MSNITEQYEVLQAKADALGEEIIAMATDNESYIKANGISWDDLPRDRADAYEAKWAEHASIMNEIVALAGLPPLGEPVDDHCEHAANALAAAAAPALQLLDEVIHEQSEVRA